MQLAAWNPNEQYVHEPKTQSVRDNLYFLYFNFDNIGDQLDSEITPLRVQWAAEEGKSELDPNSESWRRFKRLYSMQFGEQKVISLYAPELSFAGSGDTTAEQYNFGRYLRLVYLYVKPSARADFEGFVHQFIVPAATQILGYHNGLKKLRPVSERSHWRMPAYMRTVSMNVNMPTIPEFELFVQDHLLPAARETNTPMLAYRTVSGNRHNYHFLFPFNAQDDIHHDRKNLMASALLREHQLQLYAKRKKSGPQYQTAAFDPSMASETAAVGFAADLASQFHGHALEIEEIVQRVRPDMSSALEERYSKESIQFVRSSLKL